MTDAPGGPDKHRAATRADEAAPAAKDSPHGPATAGEATGKMAGKAAGETITLPSGSTARLVEIIGDVPGPTGPAWRYRFVVPDLAALVPAAGQPPTEKLTPEDMSELDRLGSDSDHGGGDHGGFADIELVSPEDLALPDFSPEDFTPDTDADREAESAREEPGLPVPPEPEVLLLDPVHEDMAWLCEHWILAGVAADEALPSQIIISFADRPTPFGSIDPRVVQLFEAFSVSPDRKSCVWEPW